jgi:uncharacterized surface protein with fasciclin (FAS1) repeats
MTNKFLSVLRYTAIVALVTCLFVVSGCDDGDKGPSIFNGTLLDFIAEKDASGNYKAKADFAQSATVDKSVALDSLVKYVAIYPDLTAMLSGSTEITFFAPSNEAFVSLTALPGLSNIKAVNPDIIKGVLAYHFVTGKKMQADLTAGSKFDTKYTEPGTTSAQQIEINSDGSLKTGSSTTNILITTPDKLATNGVMHITKSVLIPPSIGTTLSSILGTMAATVLLGKDFTNLAKVIKAADAAFTENIPNLELKVSSWLAMARTTAEKPTANTKGFTFFAAPNAVGTTAVFSDALAASLIASADKGRSFLLNHLVTSNQYTVANPPANNPDGIVKFTSTVSAATYIIPKTGTARKITVNVGTPSATNPLGVAITNVQTTPASTDFRPIVKGDLSHSNGTLHVFAGALSN